MEGRIQAAVTDAIKQALGMEHHEIESLRPATPLESAGTAKDETQRARKTQRSVAVVAAKKLADPKKYPLMDVPEVMAALGIGKSAVYDHKLLERAATGTKAVRFKTESVIALKNALPE